MADHNYFANLIWQIADLLRGPYRPPQYERVMLPMTVLRRFDCVLKPTKAKVLAEYAKRKGGKLNDDALDKLLNRAAGQRFHNHSAFDFEKLKGAPEHIEHDLVSYIKGFSSNVRRVFEYFEFENEIEKMREANILYLVVSKFGDVDLHPDAVPNRQMGLIFENLIRRFNELANETAGDHFTPREVIRLMVSILFINDDKLLATPGTVRKLLDPACGTGGMLAESQNYMRDHHGEAQLYVYGQDYNKRAFATAASDMLMKQVDHNGSGDNVRFGDSFTEDQFAGETFDYFLTNPPFGVDWKKQQREIEREHDKLGYAGRFGAGLPRVNAEGDSMTSWMSVYKNFLPEAIPEHWRVVPLKHVVRIPISDGPHETPDFVNEGIPFISAEAVWDGRVHLEAARGFISPDKYEQYSKKYRPEKDDIYIVKSGATTGKVALVDVPDTFTVWSPLAAIRSDPRQAFPRFLFYSLTGDYFQGQIRTSWSLGTQPNIAMEALENLALLLPPMHEQRAIANYLDRETARIDALIAAKERLLGLLAEKRQALITRAVTRSLDPHASLRDSGIPWLGEIPAHWDVRRVAWLFRERDQRGEPDLPLLEVSINDGVMLREFADDRIEATAADFNTYKVARRGDVVFNKMRMWQGAVGVAPEDGLVSPDYVVAEPTGALTSAYAGVFFRTPAFSAECARHSHGIVWDRLRLYWEGFRDIEVPLPPPSDQSRLIAQVDSETGALDRLSASIERSAILLRERCAALIAAAVTGRIETGVAV